MISIASKSTHVISDERPRERGDACELLGLPYSLLSTIAAADSEGFA